MKGLLYLSMLLFLHPAFAFNPGAGHDTHYVVIGAFAIEKNAVRLMRSASQEHFNAQYELNHTRNLFYVYVMTTDDRSSAMLEAERIRTATRFSDAWVFYGQLGRVEDQSVSIDVHPVSEQSIEAIHLADQVEPTQPESKKEEVNNKATAPTPNGAKNFLFRTYRGTDNTLVEGEIQVIDVDKARKLYTLKTNEPVVVPAINNKSGDVLLSGEIFGYRKVQRTISYTHPIAEDVQLDEQGNVVVPLELVRLQKGDIAVMYNVLFFKDAAIMRPESKFEVDQLLQMMQENPDQKIRIHGHTNGGAHGKIVTVGEEKNYFSLAGSKDGFGSSKKLSEARAEVIKEYLASRGVSPDRMQVKAWGGKRPIHDKNHTRAAENVRVEIEILQ